MTKSAFIKRANRFRVLHEFLTHPKIKGRDILARAKPTMPTYVNTGAYDSSDVLGKIRNSQLESLWKQRANARGNKFFPQSQDFYKAERKRVLSHFKEDRDIIRQDALKVPGGDFNDPITSLIGHNARGSNMSPLDVADYMHRVR
jgi:hypothetical protein